MVMLLLTTISVYISSYLIYCNFSFAENNLYFDWLQGDSGGPMNSKVDDVWYVTGLTSFGNVFCAGTPGVYTRVTSFYDWIHSNMQRY